MSDNLVSRRLSRSARIRKIKSIYNKHMKSTKTQHPTTPGGGNTNKKSKRKLTDYQKFVKMESRKDKYKYMCGSERMTAISAQWKLYKSKLKKSSRQ